LHDGKIREEKAAPRMAPVRKNERLMMDWITKQQCQRYDDLIKWLQTEHPPAACNGYAEAMRDSVICLLKGQKLQLQSLHKLSLTAMVAVLGSVGMVCLTMLQLTGKL